MTDPTDLDAHKMVLELLAGRRSGMTSRTEQRDAAAAILDALESTAAELHDAKREELGSYLRAIRALATTRADLARAREVIEKVRAVAQNPYEGYRGESVVRSDELHHILSTYDRKVKP